MFKKGLGGCQGPCALQSIGLIPLSNIKASFYFHLVKHLYNTTSALTAAFLLSSLKGSKFSCSVISITRKERARRLPPNITSEDIQTGTGKNISSSNWSYDIFRELSTHRNYTAEKKKSICHYKSQQNCKLLSQRSALTLNRLGEGWCVQGLQQPNASCLWSPGPPGAHEDRHVLPAPRMSEDDTKAFHSGSEVWLVPTMKRFLRTKQGRSVTVALVDLHLQSRTTDRQLDTQPLCHVRHYY